LNGIEQINYVSKFLTNSVNDRYYEWASKNQEKPSNTEMDDFKQNKAHRTNKVGQKAKKKQDNEIKKNKESGSLDARSLPHKKASNPKVLIHL
jgi:hypothetical protein